MQCKPLPKEGNRYGSGLNWNKHFSRGSEYFFEKSMSPSFDFYSEKLGYVYPKNRAFLLAALFTPNRESEKTGSPLTELYFFFLPFERPLTLHLQVFMRNLAMLVCWLANCSVKV